MHYIETNSPDPDCWLCNHMRSTCAAHSSRTSGWQQSKATNKKGNTVHYNESEVSKAIQDGTLTVNEFDEVDWLENLHPDTIIIPAYSPVYNAFKPLLEQREIITTEKEEQVQQETDTQTVYVLTVTVQDNPEDDESGVNTYDPIFRMEVFGDVDDAVAAAAAVYVEEQETNCQTEEWDGPVHGTQRCRFSAEVTTSFSITRIDVFAQEVK
jgi:hypothetical protein